jgi:hypothetical protein
VQRAIRLPALIAILFFIVSGGPFGLEGLIGAVGPGLALALLVGTPLLHSLPEALLVGELASMLPVEGGYYQWVKRAFGDGWGFWNGWLSWVYSVLDMAIYPVLLRCPLHVAAGMVAAVVRSVPPATISGCSEATRQLLVRNERRRETRACRYDREPSAAGIPHLHGPFEADHVYPTRGGGCEIGAGWIKFLVGTTTCPRNETRRSL